MSAGTTKSPRRLVATIAAGLLAGIASLLIVASPASAHGQFVSSDPPAAVDLADPVDAITLYFTEKPTSNAFFSVTTVKGARVDRLWSQGTSKPLDPPVHEWFHNSNGQWVVKSYSTAYGVKIPIAY